MFGARSLGYYSNAENTRQLPASFLASLVARVALLLSRAQHDPMLARRGGAAVDSRDDVRVCPGMPRWPRSRTWSSRSRMAGSGFQRHRAARARHGRVAVSLHMINLHAPHGPGHARLMFRLEVSKKALGVPCSWWRAQGTASSARLEPGGAFDRFAGHQLALLQEIAGIRRAGAIAGRGAADPAAAVATVAVMPIASALHGAALVKLPVPLATGGVVHRVDGHGQDRRLVGIQGDAGPVARGRSA